MLRLRDRITNALVSFDITGVFARAPGAGPADSYWELSYFPASGRSASYGSTTYGPLVVSQAALGPALTMLSGSWVAQPDMTAFGDGDLDSMSASVAALAQSLPNSTFLNGAQLVTSLPSVLAAAASNLTVARSLLVISALELLVLAIAALLAVARLLAAQREGETALLVARGATRSQLTWLTAAEVIPLSALVSRGRRARGDPAGQRAGERGAAGPGRHPARGPGGRLARARSAAAIAVTVIAAAALLAPGLTPSPGPRGPGAAGRAMVAGVARAGLDIALVVLAVLACWQLRHYSAASDGGTAGIDPVLALAPALALAAGSVATLRLLPLAARAADWLAARGRRLTRLARLLAVQPDAGPPGERGAAADHGGRDRDAGARAARELAQVGFRPGRLRDRGRRPGRPARAARARRHGRRHRRARGHRTRWRWSDEPDESRRGHRGRRGPGRPGRPAARRRVAAAAARLFARHHAGRRPAGGGAAGPPARCAAGTIRSPPRSARPARGAPRASGRAGRARAGRRDADRPRPDGRRLPGRGRDAGRGRPPPPARRAPRRRHRRRYPLRVAAITATFALPLASGPPSPSR